MVATFHASGKLAWNAIGEPVWGFLMNRIDHCIAVSEQAKASAERWLPFDFEVIPNGVLIPPEAYPGNRETPRNDKTPAGRSRAGVREEERRVSRPPDAIGTPRRWP